MAIGRIAFQETPSRKSGFDAIDNDYSLNLILTPHAETDTKDTVWNDGAQGQHLIRQKFLDLSYQGDDPPAGHPDTARWTLHCEFEGARVHYICTAGKALAPVAAVAAWAACGDGFWGLFCALLALLIVAIIALATAWAAGGDGSPADAAVDPNSGTLSDNDCIVVFGDLVYDAGHCAGWHEIHPVKHVQKFWPPRVTLL